MSFATELNTAYIQSMLDAPETETLGKIKSLWWPVFLSRYEKDGESVLDGLDVVMDESRQALQNMAETYAAQCGFQPGTAKYTQRVSQFLKSNTGKMFERFVGLSLAHALRTNNSKFCIQPFRQEAIERCHGFTRESFRVRKKLGEVELSTYIDADLMAFNPNDVTSEVFLISIKTTLKDRFHNVPFWNLLRRLAVENAFPDIVASDTARLASVKYIAICTDLAEEQPDFSGADGPRMMLQFDAGLLDGAYVTASKAVGVGDNAVHLGATRPFAFNRLTKFYEHLILPSP